VKHSSVWLPIQKKIFFSLSRLLSTQIESYISNLMLANKELTRALPTLDAKNCIFVNKKHLPIHSRCSHRFRSNPLAKCLCKPLALASPTRSGRKSSLYTVRTISNTTDKFWLESCHISFLRRRLIDWTLLHCSLGRKRGNINISEIRSLR
jgi:hypothetical protein